ncbi:hypothetical protein EDC04DRAFT_2597898 [Pisolithus marmoratus]|nr:hypothetical protein EDC04DRAFT_2597898 [Pisolithus marmoratus]
MPLKSLTCRIWLAHASCSLPPSIPVANTTPGGHGLNSSTAMWGFSAHFLILSMGDCKQACDYWPGWTMLGKWLPAGLAGEDLSNSRQTLTCLERLGVWTGGQRPGPPVADTSTMEQETKLKTRQRQWTGV